MNVKELGGLIPLEMKRIKRMKKIIVCVLSIAVLFAFAACEASTPVSYYGKNVDSITLLSAPDYVQGETLNPADLSFRVVYNNGETATRNGAELGLAPTSGTVGKDLEIDISGNYVLDATNTFGIAYGTTRPGTDGKASVPVRWTVRARPVKRLWDAAALSVSCQAFTAPAVWYYFGTFPPYFLITNLIAVPLSTAAINLSIPVIILSHLGICPEILVRADDLVICAMCRSLEIISGL